MFARQGDNGGFREQIEKGTKKARQKSGWLFRTFYSRETQFLKQVFKSLVQPHLDYCSQLWAPLEGPDLEKVERVLRDFSRKIPELRGMNYWERLERLAMNSEQRRLERSNYLCLEDNPWSGAKLRNHLDRTWGKKRAPV